MSFVPNYYALASLVSKTPLESGVQGYLSGKALRSKLQSEQAQREAVAQNITASKQAMEQEEEMAPLKKEQMLLNMDRIRSDMALDEFRKKEILAQIAAHNAAAQKSLQATATPDFKGEMGDLMHNYYLATDPKVKQLFMERAENLATAKKPEQLSELDKLSIKDFAKNSQEASSLARQAFEMNSELNNFQKWYSLVPDSAKGFKAAIFPRMAKGSAYSVGGKAGAEAFDAAQASANKIVLAQAFLNKGLGRMNIPMLKTIQEQKPNIGNSLAGNLAIINNLKRANATIIDYAKLYDEVTKSDIPDEKKEAIVRDTWQKAQDKYPLVDEKGNINLKNVGRWKDILQETVGGKETSSDISKESSKNDPWDMRKWID